MYFAIRFSVFLFQFLILSVGRTQIMFLITTQTGNGFSKQLRVNVYSFVHGLEKCTGCLHICSIYDPIRIDTRNFASTVQRVCL